jgi:hypothetical protein
MSLAWYVGNRSSWKLQLNGHPCGRGFHIWMQLAHYTVHSASQNILTSDLTAGRSPFLELGWRRSHYNHAETQHCKLVRNTLSRASTPVSRHFVHSILCFFSVSSHSYILYFKPAFPVFKKWKWACEVTLLPVCLYPPLSLIASGSVNTFPRQRIHRQKTKLNSVSASALYRPSENTQTTVEKLLGVSFFTLSMSCERKVGNYFLISANNQCGFSRGDALSLDVHTRCLPYVGGSVQFILYEPSSVIYWLEVKCMTASNQ